MKYFLDTEFIEDFHKPLFGKRRHFIDLISIGIIAEDGREYYAISNEFNANDASDWVKEHVLYQIIQKYIECISGEQRQIVLTAFGNKSHEKCIRLIQDWIGKSHEQIANEITNFVFQPQIKNRTGKLTLPEFYGYYSDYDWVLFCSLFGTMMQIPRGFPFYCIDLKQTLNEKASLITGDEKEYALQSVYKVNETSEKLERVPVKELSLEDKVSLFTSQRNYPKQNNEHNALADAKWNFELYKFLQNLN